MRKAIFFLVIAASFIAAFGVVAQDQASAPVYQEGDFWHFRLGPRVYEARVQDGKLKFFDPKPGQKTEIEAEKVPLVLRRMLAVEQDDRQFLQFPLTVGKEWSSRYQEDSKGATGPIWMSARSNVSGIEELATKAGTFRAFKIERMETFPNPSAAGKPLAQVKATLTRSYTYYYSPQTRSIVNYNFENPQGVKTEVELLKFATGSSK